MSELTPEEEKYFDEKLNPLLANASPEVRAIFERDKEKIKDLVKRMQKCMAGKEGIVMAPPLREMLGTPDKGEPPKEYL